MRTFIHRLLRLGAILSMIAAVIIAGALSGASRAAAAPLAATLPASTCSLVGSIRTCDLWAKTGTTSLPDAASVPIWSYAATNVPITLPIGPTLIVNQGETVRVILHNNLAEASSLSFPGQGLAPDTTGVAAGADNSAAPYSFTATTPGTYIYEAGLTSNGARQVALGMFGALIVRPSTAGQAYNTAATAYADEALIVLSEIDTNLNAAPSTFKMQNFSPRYWLINGKVYPNTDPITTSPGNRVLLRYVNAGLQPHSLGLLGLRQTVVANDGNLLPFSRTVIADTLGAGQTLDVITTIPATAPAGTKYALYNTGSQNRNASLRTSGVLNFGGMLTFLSVAGTPTGDTTGPTTSAVGISPNPTTGASGATLTATISDVASGGANVTAAEYRIDNGASTAISGIPGASSTAGVSVAISAATLNALTSGNHTFYVRGQDALGNWGAFTSAVLNLDKTGPAISSSSLNLPVSNGASPVTISATASDATTGNSNVVAAEYTFNGGAPVAITLNQSGPTVALSAIIPASAFTGLADGSYPITLRAQDALGNWTAPVATIALRIDTAGPVASAVSATPNPNNGTLGVNSSTNALRLYATFTDSDSVIQTGEGFIGAAGAPGAGFPLQPVDGLFNTASEFAYVDIPLANIAALANGSYPLTVRGKDAAGNWGATSSTSLLIDKTAPTFSSISLAPNPTFGATSVTLTVNGAGDTGGAGVTGGEYWFGTTNPAPGGGTAFTGMTPSIPVGSLVPGTYTVGARIRDAAGNWSAVASATLIVVPDTIFADGFESPTTLPGNWSSRSTTTASRLNNTTAAALVGARGLQAQGNNTNYVQYNFGTAANPATATYDARFYFNPNGNTGANQDILVARTAGGATVFRVRYRWNGGSPQVQIQVGTSATNAAWTGITNGAANRIEVVWQAGGALRLFVGGSAVANQSLTAGANSVAGVRLGSVTNGGSGTLEFFDAFSSKRTITPYGP